METGENGVTGELGQTVLQFVEVETEKGAEKGNVMNQNLLMVEMIVREMIQMERLKSAIQMIVQVHFAGSNNDYNI